MSKDLITYEFKPGEKYPAIFVCADAVVFYRHPERGLLLAVIERGDNGKVALPGGFVEYGETSFQAAARELKEETGLDRMALSVRHVGSLHFDDPNRTKIGNRRITTAHVFVTTDPFELTGGDDASKAFWMSHQDFMGLSEDDVHDDHKQIVIQSTWLL